MLKVWLPLNGDLRNQGISDLNTINMPTCATIDSTGKIGKCYTSDGTAVGVFTNFNFQASEFSIAAWVRINTRVNAWSCPIKLIHSTENDYIGFCCEHNTQASYIGFHFYKTIDSTNTAIFDSYPITDMPTGKWIHLTVTYDGKTVVYYKNGIKVTSGTIAAAKQNAIANIDKIIMLGSNGGRGGAAVKSSLNDVRIYDHCLSAAEVREIAQGLVLHYKLDNSINLTNNNVNTWTNFSIGQWYTTIWEMPIADFVTQTGAKNGDQFTFSIDIKTLSGQKPLKARVQQYNSGSDRPTVLSTEIIPVSSSGRSSVTFTLNTNYTLLQLLITNHDTNVTVSTTEQWKCIKLEWGNKATPWCQTYDNTIIEDSSGYNHNGEILNGPLSLTSDTPRYNISTHFSATNQKIKISNFPTSGFGNSYTFAWWAKISSATPMHWGFSDGIRLNGMYTGRLWNTGDSSNNPLYTPGTTTQVSAPTTGVWHHWAMTGDGTKCRVYQDGVLWAEAKTYKAISGTTIYINGWDNGTSYSSDNYSISDFRIYCTPLLDTDIKQLYNVGMKVDKNQNIHNFELIEKNYNIFSATPWCNEFYTHTPITSPFINFNSNGEPQFTTNNSSAGTDYLEITPGIYEYDYTISVNTGNQFYIGFERYDADKTSRSNNACVYTYSTKPSADVVKQRYKGTVNLSTDGTNQLKYIALRILNGWSGTTSGVTGQATIHNFSLRLQSAAVNPKITKAGQLIGEEFKEYSNAKFYKDHIIEANQFIER